MAFIRPLSRRTALALLLVLSLAAHAPLAQKARDCTVRLTLLQVNDVYQFMPVDRGAHGGVARISTLRKRVQAESPNTLFLLAGDTISPSVESITYKGRQMIDAWNAVGLDYSVFGNHEFDFGADELRKRVAESKFKWLGANVVEKKTGQTFAGTPVFEVREFDGVKVGLFGIVLPETATTSTPGPDVVFRETCDTARTVVGRLRAKGVNTIVALTHLSLDEDKQLARCAPGIDLIVGGHEHTLLQSSAAGVPIFKMTADGREVGRFDLHLNPKTGKVESLDWEVIPVTPDIPEDPEFASVMEKYGAKLKELAEVVGQTAVDLDARSATSRTEETNIADYIADSFREAAGADVALLNGGTIRADAVISKGPLALRDVLSILPFGGELVKIEVTGDVLRKALEHGVSRTGPGSEPGRFPQVSGLRYSFDASLAPGARLREVTVAGQPLDPRKTYTLVTSKYLADGGDQYDMFKGARNLLTARLTDSGVLLSAIAAAKDKTIGPEKDGRVRRLDKDAVAEPCKPSAAVAGRK